MPKALCSACLVLWICFGGSAWAGKQKIAILGLEAAPGPSGAVDPQTTQVARDITKELRQRAQSGASPYVIAPNSNKELTDEKLLMSCDTEAAGCMVVIGAGLAAEVLVYGRIERKGDVYRVSLKLLDVKAKTIQPLGDELPVGGSVTGVSKRLFTKLAGEVPSVSGTLVVKAKDQAGAKITSGSVMVDEDLKGDLAKGKLTVTEVAEGRHTVAIEAGGYRRFEETVTIRGGEQTALDAILLDKVAPPSLLENTLLWKVSLGTGIAVALAGGGFSLYSYNMANAHFAIKAVNVMGPAGASVTDNECDKDYNTILNTSTPMVTSFDYAVFKRGCTWKSRIYLGFVVGGIGALGAVASLIILSRDTGPSEKPSTGTRAKKPDIAIIPMWTPGGGGASLSVTW